jgi:hypothetical protein
MYSYSPSYVEHSKNFGHARDIIWKLVFLVSQCSRFIVEHSLQSLKIVHHVREREFSYKFGKKYQMARMNQLYYIKYFNVFT